MTRKTLGVVLIAALAASPVLTAQEAKPVDKTRSVIMPLCEGPANHDGSCSSVQAPAADSKAALPEIEQLRGELLRVKEEAFQLRLELARQRAATSEVRAAYDTVTLTAEQQAVERDKAAYVEKMRALLKPGKDDVFDWATLTFKAKPKEGGA